MVLLLSAVKKDAIDRKSSFIFVQNVLGEMYHPQMLKMDIVGHVFEIYFEMLNYPEFEIPFQIDLPVLFTNNFKSTVSTMHFARIPDDKFIESFLNTMLDQMRMARIDWCKDQLDLAS